MLFFIFFFFFITNLLSFKNDIYQIESGFQNLNKTSMKTFSINFFFILIIFIIFDLELMILIPFIFKKNFFFFFFIMNFIFLTYLMEIFLNKIIWKN